MHRAGYLGGNDASVHRLGRQSRRLADDTRDVLLRRLGLTQREVVFCGSMREADTLAVLGLAHLQRERHGHRTVVLSSDAAWDGLAEVLCRNGFAVQRCAHAPAKAGPATGLLAVRQVDDAGALRDLNPWRASLEGSDAFWHVDAGAALARALPDPGLAHAASITVGSTPLGGPSGVAALVLQRDLILRPLWGGGGQQRGVRSGTAATPQIAGFGAALRPPDAKPGAACEL